MLVTSNNHFVSGIQISAIEALADHFEMGWTVAQYKKNRKKSKSRNALVYPSWEDVDAAQKLCNVPLDKIQFGEHTVQASMQDVLDHQLMKIKDQSIIDQLKKLQEKYPDVRFELVFKFGSDGSSSYSEHQNKDQNCSNLFASNLVPLFIEAKDPKSGKCLNVWANKFANSASGVCPLRWSWEKESTGG